MSKRARPQQPPDRQRLRFAFGRAVACSCLLLAALPAGAQQPPTTDGAGPFARLVVIEPKPQQSSAFREGYRRHLQWHREAEDPWTWYGWRFVLGERLGAFMDGTFGHSAEDFNTAVDPAGDAADNALNVTPYADFTSHGMYERLEEMSAGAPLPDTTAYLALTTFYLVPGGEQAFESLLLEHRADPDGPASRYTWLRLRTGGTTPQYLLLRPVATFGAAAALPDFFPAGALRRTTPSRIVEAIRDELLRYEPSLSYHP